MLGVDLRIPAPDYVKSYLAYDYHTSHVRGWVADANPHITLLSYVLPSANVDQIIDSVSTPRQVTIDGITVFENKYRYCVCASVNNSLINQTSQTLADKIAHIIDPRPFTPHIALTYLNKNETIRNRLVDDLKDKYTGLTVETTTIRTMI